MSRPMNFTVKMPVDDFEFDEEFANYDFYDLTTIYTDDDGNITGCKDLVIHHVKFLRILKNIGFRRIDIANQSFLVLIEDNVIEEVDQQYVIDTFVKHVQAMPHDHPHYRIKDKIINKIYRGLATYFSELLLKRLVDDRPREFLKDGKDCTYFFYRNGCVKVTKDQLSFLEYKNIDQYIWKNQILDRDFKILEKPKFLYSNWGQFVSNIADNYIKDGQPNNPSRFEDFKRIIGYNLHGYFQGKLKATIFTDSRVSDEADGRTGKTLLCKGMGHMLNVNPHARTFTEINGKDFDPTDRFKWQELSIDTKLVHLNDVKKYFPFDVLFNDISEGIKRQRKNEMPFHVWAKIILSTNRTIKLNGSSSEDRSIEFEMADYYSSKFSPLDEFKEWFFRDWDKTKWLQFDNFMIHCVQEYLMHGLTSPETINLKIRKLMEETCREFVEFMGDINFQNEEYYDKKKFYERFKNEVSDYDKVKQKTFTNWIRSYAKYKDHISTVLERRSNGVNMFAYKFEAHHIAAVKEMEEHI